MTSVNVTVNVFFSFETFSCMQILSLIAIQKGFVKIFWLSASHLLSNHVENSQVDLFLDLETFFFLVHGNWQQFGVCGSRGFKTENKKFWIGTKKNLLANFEFNSFTTVLEITKIMNFKLWRTVRKPVVQQSCWKFASKLFLAFRNFFLFLSVEIDRNLASALPHPANAVANMFKPKTKKFLNSIIKNLLANFAFNSYTTVLEITKIMNFQLWQTVRKPVVKQSCWKFASKLFLVFRNYFLFLSAEIDRNLASAASAFCKCGREHLQTWNQKVLK